MKKLYLCFCIIVSILIIGETCAMAAQQQREFIRIGQAIDAEFVQVSAPTISGNIEADPGMMTMISTIYGVVAYICYAAAFIVVLIQGVRFMNAAPEAKAELKKQFVAIAIGATMVFGIVGILQIIINVTASLF